VTSGNVLYYGDNLDILHRYIADESVGLVYLDPPFNSNATYNVLFAEQDGSRAAAQVEAFTDTWRWDQAAVAAYEETVDGGGRVADALRAMRTLLGGSNMLAYLSMMAPRLVELRRVLRPTGSLYLHCDPTASHYLNLLLDAVFGPERFRNEIVWCYTGPSAPKQRQFSRKHDVIFWYSRGDQWTFNADAVRVPYSGKTLENYKQGLVGSGFVAGDDEAVREINAGGKIPEDYWNFAIAPRGKEYLGYPTQKPIALLERIIKASSNPGDVVLDPFCGCGTAVDAAQRLGRQWIGVDITHLAINLIKHRLMDAYGDTATFAVIGEPTDVASAADLAASDPYQFQWWALGLVGARPAEQKKGADHGIDGRLYFHEQTGGETKQVVFSVKAGGTGIDHVRVLLAVVAHENAALGVLITMQDSTKPMRQEAAEAGSYTDAWGQRYPRLQLFTVGELLAGKKVEMPMFARNTTVAQAKDARPPLKEGTWPRQPTP
jgi:DNA modification methylase